MKNCVLSTLGTHPQNEKRINAFLKLVGCYPFLKMFEIQGFEGISTVIFSDNNKTKNIFRLLKFPSSDRDVLLPLAQFVLLRQKMNEDEVSPRAKPRIRHALKMSSRFPIFIARDKYIPWRKSNRPYTRTQSTGKTDKPRNSGAVSVLLVTSCAA